MRRQLVHIKRHIVTWLVLLAHLLTGIPATAAASLKPAVSASNQPAALVNTAQTATYLVANRATTVSVLSVSASNRPPALVDTAQAAINSVVNKGLIAPQVRAAQTSATAQQLSQFAGLAAALPIAVQVQPVLSAYLSPLSTSHQQLFFQSAWRFQHFKYSSVCDPMTIPDSWLPPF